MDDPQAPQLPVNDPGRVPVAPQEGVPYLPYPTKPSGLPQQQAVMPARDVLPKPVPQTSNPQTATPPADMGAPLNSSGRPIFSPDAPVPAVTQQNHRKRKAKGVIVGLVAAIIVLAGGSAAAYFGIIVPNRPENILRSALRNTLQQKYVTATADLSGKDPTTPNYKLHAVIKADVDKKSVSANTSFTVKGFTIPIEGRLVDDEAFFKVGDISEILNIWGVLSPKTKGLADALNPKISNQWVSIDSTLLKDAGITDCEQSVSLSEKDYGQIDKLYEQHRFVTIDKVSSDQVNKRSAGKYELTIVDNKSADFFDSLDELPAVKKMNECFNKSTKKATGDEEITAQANNPLKNNDKTPLTVWIDKKTKLITKVASHSSEQDRKKGIEGTGEVVFDYQPVKIEKPTGAHSITRYFDDILKLFVDTQVGGDDPLNSFDAPN